MASINTMLPRAVMRLALIGQEKSWGSEVTGCLLSALRAPSGYGDLILSCHSTLCYRLACGGFSISVRAKATAVVPINQVIDLTNTKCMIKKGFWAIRNGI